MDSYLSTAMLSNLTCPYLTILSLAAYHRVTHQISPAWSRSNLAGKGPPTVEELLTSAYAREVFVASTADFRHGVNKYRR